MLTIRIVWFYFDSLKFGVSDAPIKIFWLLSFWEWKFAKLQTVGAGMFKLAVLLVPFSSEFLLDFKFSNSSIRIYKDVFMVTCSAKLFRCLQYFKFLNRVFEFDNNCFCFWPSRFSGMPNTITFFSFLAKSAVSWLAALVISCAVCFGSLFQKSMLAWLWLTPTKEWEFWLSKRSDNLVSRSLTLLFSSVISLLAKLSFCCKLII